MSAPDLPDDPGGLRLAMNWFHTWFGLVLGALMFVIFWTGTLAVFDREIDRWMMPATRLTEPPDVSADAIAAVMQAEMAGARGWRIILPDGRTPVAEVQISSATGEQIRRFVDPARLRVLPEQATYGATHFFYPYHFRLNSGAIGLFLCAFAAVVMLALCISGVIVHRRIFADFFTLRIVRKPQRTTLDLHNLSGVLTLPFLLMISFTGVAIFSYTYLPSAGSIIFGRDPGAMAAGYFSRDPAGRPGGASVPLDLLRDKAAAYWHSDRPAYVQLVHPGDANAYVELRPDSSRTIAKSTAAVWFDAASGDLISGSPITPVRRAYDVIYGIHLIQFDHWALRWLYFLSGLAGCVLIATGMLFWVQSRQKRHRKQGRRSGRLVEAVAIGSTTGLLIATLAFLIANRLLPPDLTGRASAEVWLFHAAWLLAVLHAALRGHSAWREQGWLIAMLCVAAVVLNAITTADNLPAALLRGLWHTAGVDLTLLASGAIAAGAASRLGRRARQAAAGE
ncbi:PepSY domain-containing protein [Altererythrobacter xixiisoli]|uniref:PepSY domain-containing protein n=1 Tax=Croceibacterium xixiisoli TaxID=1476466 RepID=A0A6I4U086_9SPHN|nr:PepSY-associated TM helix domain-containing protein [Croceibacterium xixiisoli]MXP00742.1 PepSY domain-containing protein [Croceibacterium xixiisoli]